MSVILTIASEKSAVIAGDSRAINTFNNKVISESHKKTRKINERIILGYSGAAIPSEMIYKFIVSSIKKNPKILVEDIVCSIEKQYLTMPKDLRIAFTICGEGKNGKMCAAMVTTYQPIQINYPSGNTISYYEFYPKEIPIGFNLYENLIQIKPPLEAMKLTIEYCSRLSPSVNNVMNYEYLEFD